MEDTKVGNKLRAEIYETESKVVKGDLLNTSLFCTCFPGFMSMRLFECCPNSLLWTSSHAFPRVGTIDSARRILRRCLIMTFPLTMVNLPLSTPNLETETFYARYSLFRPFVQPDPDLKYP